MVSRADWHCHTHRSNIQHRDSINFESGLIDRALELGLKGVAITDHGVLSGHIAGIKHLNKLKGKATGERLKRLEEFKLGLGTEIYLVHREVVEKARENYESTRFNHLVLVAKNEKGYDALRELSSKAWEDSFYYRGVERIPTYWDWFIPWAQRNRGNIIVTTACLGSEFSQLVLKFIEEQTQENRQLIVDFVTRMQMLFGEDFYIEIQPSYFEEQIKYNELAIQIADSFGVKVVIDCDAHYLSKEQKEIHSIYLKSQNAERETEEFYSSTYLMGVEELREYFPYLDSNRFNSYMENSLEIADKIENYELHKEIIVPQTTIQYDESMPSILLPRVTMFNFERKLKYPYIYRYLKSSHLTDKILIQQIEKGLIKKNISLTEEVLERLEVELEALWEISEKLHQRMASYYLLTKEIVEIMWLVSLVGVSRGSAGAFYICYLLDICQINPIKSAYDLPYWRHIDKHKIELAD